MTDDNKFFDDTFWMDDSPNQIPLIFKKAVEKKILPVRCIFNNLSDQSFTISNITNIIQLSIAKRNYSVVAGPKQHGLPLHGPFSNSNYPLSLKKIYPNNTKLNEFGQNKPLPSSYGTFMVPKYKLSLFGKVQNTVILNSIINQYGNILGLQSDNSYKISATKY